MVDTSGGRTTASSIDTGSTDDSGASTGTSTTMDTGDSTDTGDEESGTSTGPEPATVCPVFLDTFDVDVIDLLWDQQSPESLSQGDGELQINVTGAVGDQFARVQVLPEANGLEGATARIEIGDAPAVDGVLLILWVQPLNNDGRIAFNLTHYGDQILLEARITPEVGPASIVATTPWTPETMQWMQLREDAGMLFFEVSEDGSTFETVFEMPTPIDVSSAYIGFVGHNILQLAEDAQVSVRTFELMCAE